MLSTLPPAQLSDDALVAELEACAAWRRQVDARVAALSGEIAARSTFELGYSGLAQQRGARTPALLVQQITGVSKSEAAAMVRVGTKPEYLQPVSADLLGVAKVDAVRSGLGEPSESVSHDDLLLAAVKVAEQVGDLTVEQAAAHARAVRDELDADNVARREAEQREQRYLSIARRTDGMYSVHGLLDAESAEILTRATDAIIAPRRGGPRFVDEAKAAEQERLAEEDRRTIPQMMVDALVDLVSIAVRTEPGIALTGSKGSVVVHTNTAGVGYFEGSPDAISAPTVQRFSCDNSTVMVDFESGLAIDVGWDQRLFTRKQRVALAARDGGCMFPGCDRPPSWTEAHHINEWVADHGRTDTADGILLCRHHHMLLHNNRWRITRTGTQYELHSPGGDVTPLESKSPLYRQPRGGAQTTLGLQPLVSPIGRTVRSGT